MKKITSIIVDDEARARRVLHHLLQTNVEQISVLGEYDSVTSAIKGIEEHQPDVVFLDVQMPNYNGYELFNFIDQPNFEVIFVTAFDEYAIKAFEFNAIDYLTKPVDRNRLQNAVEKAIDRIEEKKQIQDYKELIASFEDKELKNIVINELNSRKVVPLKDIVAIEGQGAYSVIHFTESKKLTVSKNLKHFEGLLNDHHQFFRCHKSWIISVDKVKSYSTSQFTITMDTNLQLRLSKSKKNEFEEVLTS